jgi:hypothetical protein
MKEKHHWMFPLHTNRLQHLYLILCNDVDGKVVKKILYPISPAFIQIFAVLLDKNAEEINTELCY